MSSWFHVWLGVSPLGCGCVFVPAGHLMPPVLGTTDGRGTYLRHWAGSFRGAASGARDGDGDK